MNLSRHPLCWLFLAFAIFPIGSAGAQVGMQWIDIALIDTLEYTEFSVDRVSNAKYPPQQLFDADLKTTWVNSDELTSVVPLYMKLPDTGNRDIHLFPGYGKSAYLFRANSRPAKLKITLYVAILPDGYVSEYGAQYKAVEFPFEQTVQLRDSFSLQHVVLEIDENNLAAFTSKVRQEFEEAFSMPMAGSCSVLKMEILEVFPGTRYNDICISEIFFNDCLVSFGPEVPGATEKIYISASGHSLAMVDADNRTHTVYRDTSSVLQLLEISKDRHWAILLSVPASIDGRAETTYLLIDLQNKKMVNAQLSGIKKDYAWGQEMYFGSREGDGTELFFTDTSGQYSSIWLR